MSRNPTSKEVTKRAVLAELERLRQGRHARYQTLVGRFARCPDLIKQPLFALPQSMQARALTTARHSTPRPAGFLRSVDGSGKWSVMPRLDAVPVVHRLVADDRLAVMLAKALLELDIAVPGDWKKADHDPTSFIRITLERWIHAHGGPAIRHRFLLSAVISNSPS